MLKQFQVVIFGIFALIYSFQGIADEGEYKEKIAQSYDKKTNDEVGLNFKLAKSDDLFFNHNGIVTQGDPLEWYASRIHNEDDRLNIIHSLEKNTVYFALPYLGSPNKNAHLLDAGCGAGGSGLMIHQAFECDVEGFTLSQGQADFANKISTKKGYQDKVRFFQGDMLNIERPDSFYDYIWACESTEHVQDLNVMLREFARVSKPNSRLVIIAWCANDPVLKKTVDAHYITDIHTAREYLEVAAKTGWKALHQVDLTARTAEYWKIRSLSKNVTGSEKFMGPGFASGNLQYFLFTFENSKSNS